MSAEFQERLLLTLNQAKQVPESAHTVMSRGGLIDPIVFECPICQQPMVMISHGIADCKNESCDTPRLYLNRGDPSLGIYIGADSHDHDDGDYAHYLYRISWDATGTSFGVETHESCQGNYLQGYDSWEESAKIMTPDDAKKHFATLRAIAFAEQAATLERLRLLAESGTAWEMPVDGSPDEWDDPDWEAAANGQSVGDDAEVAPPHLDPQSASRHHK